MGEVQGREFYSASVNNIWDSYNKHIGNVHVGQTVDIQFKSVHPLDVKNISTSCGCTGAKYDAESRTLTATYKAKPIPKHLVSKGFYNARLSVVVEHDGQVSTLIIRATVTK